MHSSFQSASRRRYAEELNALYPINFVVKHPNLPSFQKARPEAVETCSGPAQSLGQPVSDRRPSDLNSAIGGIRKQLNESWWS